MVRFLKEINKKKTTHPSSLLVEPFADCLGAVLNLKSAGLDSISRLIDSLPKTRQSVFLCAAPMEEDNAMEEENTTDVVELMRRDEDGVDVVVKLVTVGSIVRAPLPLHPEQRRRAIIATIQKDEGTVCVFWEDEAPSSLLANDASMVAVSPTPSRDDFDTNFNRNSSIFEATVAIQDIQPLLDFETTIPSRASDDDEDDDEEEDDDDENTTPTRQRHTSPPQHPKEKKVSIIDTFKDRADTLLRLGDSSAAVPYYELALHQMGSSPHIKNISVGGLIVVKQKGFFKLAQIDCINTDDIEIDVTFLDDTQQEITITIKDVMLVLPRRDDGLVQERILLNLGRCFLRLAETTFLVQRRRPAYLKAAVRATSLAYAVGDFREQEAAASFFRRTGGSGISTGTSSSAGGSGGGGGTSATKTTALLLRGQAQLGLSKFAHAIGDARRVLKLDPKNKAAQTLLRDCARKQREMAKVDKKLVKELCQFINSATATGTANSTTGTGTAASSMNGQSGMPAVKEGTSRSGAC